MKTGIFYGSTTGTTQEIAETVAEILKSKNIETELFDICEEPVSTFADFDNLILASSTWHDGQLQDSWSEVYDDLESFDFSIKKTALIGVGDQEGFSDYFLNALGHLAKAVKNSNGKLFGKWLVADYSFDSSIGIDEDGKFFGLGLDNDNQSDLTEQRLNNWVEQLESEGFFNK